MPEKKNGVRGGGQRGREGGGEQPRREGGGKRERPQDPCIRPENEDDDGYDPYSDRRPEPEPLFEPDPWD